MTTSNKTEKKLFIETSVSKAKVINKVENNPYILMTLQGPCMEMGIVNRNNRLYSEKLVRERILENKIVKDKMDRGVLFGESEHPVDRVDSTLPQISISVSKLWIPENDNTHLWGEFKILNTTAGRDLAAIVGSTVNKELSVSARAMGSSSMGPHGEEILESSDYDFITFDAVVEPGFSSARVHLCESIKRDKTKFEKMLPNDLDSNDDEKILERYRSSVSPDMGKKSEPKVVKNEGVSFEIPKSLIESARKQAEEIRSMKQQIEQLKSEKAELHNKVSESEIGLDRANKDANVEKQKKIAMMANANKLSEDLKSKNILLKKELNFSQKKMSSLKEKFSKLDLQYKSVVCASSELIENKKTFEKEISDLKQKVIFSKSKLAKMEEQNNGFKEKNNSLIKENSRLLEKLKNYKKELANLSEELISSKDRISSLNERLSNERAEKKQVKSELLSIREKLGIVRRKELASKLSIKKTEIKESLDSSSTKEISSESNSLNKKKTIREKEIANRFEQFDSTGNLNKEENSSSSNVEKSNSEFDPFSWRV